MQIPLSSVNLSDREMRYVRDALETGWISGTGDYVRWFEEAVAAKVGRKYAVAVSNGTVAIEAALRALGIGPGDEVIVPALTFVAPAAMVCAVGAQPVFADVTADDWTIDPAEVAELITPCTKAIIAVDVLGHPCDYDALEQFGLPIVEDAAEAHGARYKGRPAGSLGLVSAFSFHANKAITTGEGGCVVTDDAELANRIRLLTNHGMTPERPYWHDLVGFNFRMTNLTAAIGVGQVERWDALVAARQRSAAAYDVLLAGCGLQRRPVAPWATEACWLYTVASPYRDLLLRNLRDAGVDARAVWPALCDLPIYADACRGDYPVARQVAATAFWLPTWADMPPKALRQVVDALRQAAAVAA